MCDKEILHKKYHFVPPDGKWGYVVCLAVSTILVILTGLENSFSVIYKERFIELAMDSTNVAILNGVGVIFVAISGFVTGFVLQYTTIRKLGLLASILYSMGTFGSAFSNVTVAFYIFQGIIQNIGHGIILNICYTVMIQYFDQKRLLAMSLVQALTASTSFITPAAVKWLLDRFGSHWSLLLISAISLHNVFAIVLMQPVSWHLKKIELPGTKINETKPFVKQYAYTRRIKRQLSNIDEDIDTKIVSKRNIIRRLFGDAIYKKFILSNASLGLSICLFSDLVFTTMLPQALYFKGWNKVLVVRALTLFGVGNLLTRVLFIVGSKWLSKIGPHEFYVIGLLVACLSRLGMLWSDNRTIMLIFLVIMGSTRCVLVVLHPIVIAACVSAENFSKALGISMLMFGFVNIILGPVIGAIRELTDSYSTAFYILSSCFGIVVIFWTIELIYKKNEHKRKPKISVSDKT